MRTDLLLRRLAFLPVLVLSIGLVASASLAQPGGAADDEAAIRALEEEERVAVLDQDFDALARIWSPRFMVNTPRNEVAPDRNAVLDVFRQGLAHYTSFDRRVERVLLDGDLAIVMGAETVNPIGSAPHAGETVERRFTNIWRREDKQWRLFARHANNIAPSPSGTSSSGDGWEEAVRAAEERHRQAFLANDLDALQNMLSDDFVVNSPRNTIIERDQLLGLVRSGALALSSFEQEIESVRRFGDVVTVMGEDAVTYAAPSPNAGQTHRRRFTDLWRLDDGRWRFVARQANVICP